MKIKDVLETIKERSLPIAREHETIADVLKRMLDHPHTRLVYIVDENGKYLGTISLGMLMRYLFKSSFEPSIHPLFIVPMITSETAKDIMNKGLIYATLEEDVDKVIKRMIKSKIKEIAVLDDGKKIIADITMLDLLRYCRLEDGNGCPL